MLSISVNGTITDCDISVDNNDFYDTRSGGGIWTRWDGTAELDVEHNQAVFPISESRAYGTTHTNTITSTDIISSATLYYYIESYGASKGVTKIYDIWMSEADETGYFQISNNVAYVSTGWKTYALSSDELEEIDRDGGTTFKFTMDDPGLGKYRFMELRAREFIISDTYDMYLRVTHETPSSGYCNGNYTSGTWKVNVTQNITCNNEFIPVSDDMLIEGNLTFHNISFDFNSTINKIYINQTIGAGFLIDKESEII